MFKLVSMGHDSIVAGRRVEPSHWQRRAAGAAVRPGSESVGLHKTQDNDLFFSDSSFIPWGKIPPPLSPRPGRRHGLSVRGGGSPVPAGEAGDQRGARAGVRFAG